MEVVVEIPTLQRLCQQVIVNKIESSTSSNSSIISEVCKYLPSYYVEPIFQSMLENGTISEAALVAYLVPCRHTLKINGATQIRNSVFKQIGYNCPNVSDVDLSGCPQISNSVVRVILQGCPHLQSLVLDNCQKVTHAAFDLDQSPFQCLVGCLSLEQLSLQGCPQIKGDIIGTLNANCRRLRSLNISQCKKVRSPHLHRLFGHRQLLSLNIAFIDDICDETFAALDSRNTHLAPVEATTAVLGSLSVSTAPPTICSPLQKLNLSKSRITDTTLLRLHFLQQLLEIRLQWCHGITDKGVASLVGWSPHLRHIDLQSCVAVSNEAVAHIARGCAQLRYLNLSWCPAIGTEGIQHLVPRWLFDGGCATQSSPPRHLETLSLVWCSQVDDETVKALAAIPSLRTAELIGCAAVNASFASALLGSKGVHCVL